jgi:hypothetical protein
MSQKIVPKMINRINNTRENSHKLTIQLITFGENSSVALDGRNLLEYGYYAKQKVQLIDCNTQNMENDANKDKVNNLIIQIDKPSQDNKGHFIYIKDSSGGCGVHEPDSRTNSILVNYLDESDDGVPVGSIVETLGKLTIYSNGTSWVKY